MIAPVLIALAVISAMLQWHTVRIVVANGSGRVLHDVRVTTSRGTWSFERLGPGEEVKVTADRSDEVPIRAEYLVEDANLVETSTEIDAAAVPPSFSPCLVLDEISGAFNIRENWLPNRVRRLRERLGL
jgi:hypothetical protein